jgi:DNA-binding CsgD family transcriptional regulator
MAALLRHVAVGHRASSYGRHANIAPATYKTHRQNVLAKTGAASVELFVIRLLSDELRQRRRARPPRPRRG